MKMTQVKTAELTGRALDWAVAEAQGWVRYPDDGIERGAIWHTDPDRAPYGGLQPVATYRPSTDWVYCGLLIEKYRVSLEDVGIGWIARQRCVTGAQGSMEPQDDASPLVAACRAVVVSVLGEVVRVPAELLCA